MARPGDKPPHFIRAWRKHRGYTLMKLAERIDMTHQNLGKIERYQVPYNEYLLEKLGDALRATPADIINIDPSKGEDAVWSIYETLTPPQRRQAAAMLRVIQGDKTGTDEG